MTAGQTSIANMKENPDQPGIIARSNRKKLKELSKRHIKNPFNVKHAHFSAVYGMLVVGIVMSIVTAIMIFIDLPTAAQHNALTDAPQWLHQHKSTFSIAMIFIFMFALTTWLALVSIIKRDKLIARLLAKFRSINRQSNEQLMLQTSMLTKTLQAKDHFFGIATHDLKAPLNGITGIVELMKMENTNMSATQVEYLGHIQYSCTKMQGLINDILEVNRMEQGKAIMIWQKVSITTILRSIQLSFAFQASKKNIDLHIQGIDAIMETDPDGLIRILENLLSNAIKFSPRKKKVSLIVTTDNYEITFKVCDEGPGIPQEEQPRLFNKFQRLSNRPTNSELSTGLGLSIVKELVTLLAGEITFTSEVGKGTTFVVRFPRFQPQGYPSKLNKRNKAVIARQIDNQTVQPRSMNKWADAL